MDGLEIGLHFVQWKEERRCARRARRGFLRRGNECLRLLHNMKQSQIASLPPSFHRSLPARLCLRLSSPPLLLSGSGQLAMDVVSWLASLANPSKRSSYQLTYCFCIIEVSPLGLGSFAGLRLGVASRRGQNWRPQSTCCRERDR